MEVKIRCVAATACEVGEGPVWDVDQQRLLWVDVIGKAIHAFQPDTELTRTWHLSEMIGFVLPCDDGRWVAGLETGLAYVDLGEDRNAEIEFIDKPEIDLPENRFNDGACDVHGRLWCGTMHMPGTECTGKLYCYDHAARAKVMDKGYMVTNGPAFSRDDRTLYHCETAANEYQPQGIYAFDVDADGTLHGKRLLVDYRSRKGAPDGLTVDADDYIWVGEWSGGKLACFDRHGELLKEVCLPTTHVTKAAFGGRDLDRLFVTTAAAYLPDDVRAAEPLAGGLFELSGLGKGFAPYSFDNTSLATCKPTAHVAKPSTAEERGRWRQ